MIKTLEDGRIKITDQFCCDLTQVKPELKEKFQRSIADFKTAFKDGKAVKPPLLVVTVAATHAGIVNGNYAFYRPDTMKKSLHTFTKDYPKPVLTHHNDMRDPVGRVKRAEYRDISSTYKEQIREFRERYCGTVFTDKKVDQETAFDQVKWIMKNLVPRKDYKGLGYGELDLYITDMATAERVLDERYLTVSVGFAVDSAFCSKCHVDWSKEGPCDHERGKMYDGLPMVLIPGNFQYEEVSWVNTPADPNANIISVTETRAEPAISHTTDSAGLTEVKVTESVTRPILISVDGGTVSRLDSYRHIDQVRAQEVLTVAKSKEKNKKEEPKLVEYEFNGEKISFNPDEMGESAGLLEEDAKRLHYLADEADGHTHRIIVDPETFNGHTDYVDGHSHDVVNKEVQPASKYIYDDNTGEGRKEAPHAHDFGKKLEPLTDAAPVVPVDSKDKESKETESKETEGTENTDNQNENEFEIADFDYDTHMVPELEALTEELGEDAIKDARLSAEQRKKLPASAFCGPGRSFPVPDCAHVTAARRLIGRAKGLSDAQRSRILSCVARKAKNMGCGGSKKKDEAEVLTLVIQDPKGEKQDLELAFTAQEDFTVMLKGLDPDMVEHNRSTLEEACGIFGINLADYATPMGTATAPAPLQTAQAELEREFGVVNETIIDNLIQAMLDKVGDDVKRKELGEYIVDKLIEKGIIEDVFTDYNALSKELEEANEKLARLTKANRDFYSSKQDDLARVVVALKVALKKPGFDQKLTVDQINEKAKEFKTRSVDSLSDTVNDLLEEYTGRDDNAQPRQVNLEPQNPDLEVKDNKQTGDNKIDVNMIRDLPDAETYHIAAVLQSKHQASESEGDEQ